MSPHYADYDSLSPILVSTPPPGVDFRNCLTDSETGHCCVDFVRIFIILLLPGPTRFVKVYVLHQVGEIRSAVEDPVLECVTREETVCHTTYITQYTPVKVTRAPWDSVSVSSQYPLSVLGKYLP